MVSLARFPGISRRRGASCLASCRQLWTGSTGRKTSAFLMANTDAMFQADKFHSGNCRMQMSGVAPPPSPPWLGALSSTTTAGLAPLAAASSKLLSGSTRSGFVGRMASAGGRRPSKTGTAPPRRSSRCPTDGGMRFRSQSVPLIHDGTSRATRIEMRISPPQPKAQTAGLCSRD
jgi:hypothetical protein